ncbi:MAG: glycoside hydrolase family 73 protein [Limosilactobacillus gorillae]|uniref:glycoside hydrolase family 73 protein n=1 Tax=Limosilactobacillus gorillae TaxID=1450649 RepID=UPI000B8486A9|nr:glycoside hydrolase family 73 protein [Limosilactobacillus gorillae]MDO4855091.1 glycoside hydrolase family 73 protein [Limosilactobacillus gorillae]
MMFVKKTDDVITIIAGLIVSLLVVIGVGIGAAYYHQTTLTETHSPKITTKQFIKEIAPAAQQVEKKYGIPASIIIAQAGTESNWGRAKLAYKYNNLFGIKASTKNRVKMYTKETLNGKTVTIKQYFQVYPSWKASIQAHTRLILNGTTDNPNRYKGMITKSYTQAAWALQNNGYATDPNYANELIYAIQKFHLAQYD